MKNTFFKRVVVYVLATTVVSKRINTMCLLAAMTIFGFAIPVLAEDQANGYLDGYYYFSENGDTYATDQAYAWYLFEANDDYLLDSELEYLLEELNRRLMEFEPIMPRVEVSIPEGGLGSMLEIEPIDTSHLQTELRYDSLGYSYEVYTDESFEWLRAEMMRVANESITPEFEAYVEAISAEVAFLAKQHDAFFEELVAEMGPSFAKHGVDISPLLSDHPTLVNTTNMFNRADGMTYAQIGQMTLIGGAASVASAILTGTDSRRGAARHFFWTRRLTLEMGLSNAQILTNNNEFSSIVERQRMITPGTTDAQLLAHRIIIHNTAIASLAGFNNVISNDHVMDFWNNRAGAISGLTNPNPSQSEVTLFNNEWSAGRLIRGNQFSYPVGHPNLPTQLQRNELRTSFWWTHTFGVL